MNNITTSEAEVSVNVNGRPVRLYSHEGRIFCESRTGTEYSIVVKNNSWRRVEVVASVDGLSVLTGKPASTDERGYIVRARDQIVIKGFRKDSETVGAFKFTEKSSSYAAEKGQSDNTGIIAVRVFAEDVPLPTYGGFRIDPTPWVTPRPFTTPTPYWVYCSGTVYDDQIRGCTTGYFDEPGYGVSGQMKLSSMNASASTTSGSVTAYNACINPEPAKSFFSHGTTWGQKVEDKVTLVSFDRGYLVSSFEIFYDSKENLEARGIKLTQEKALPVGFPGDFATPPVGWNG